MNKGIKLSSGKYVIFLNGGDYFFSKSSLNIFEHDRTEDLMVISNIIILGILKIIQIKLV